MEMIEIRQRTVRTGNIAYTDNWRYGDRCETAAYYVATALARCNRPDHTAADEDVLIAREDDLMALVAGDVSHYWDLVDDAIRLHRDDAIRTVTA